MSRGKPWRVSDAARQRRAVRAENLRSERTRAAREKNWKLLDLRSHKLARAQQLGFDYPRKAQRELIDEHVIDGTEEQSR